MESRLDSALEEAITSKRLPGIAAIALDKSGDVLYKGVYGKTSISDPKASALTSSTPIPVWSCTKLVTSVAALQLLEQGKLSLSDPVEKYIPIVKDIQVLDGFNDDGSPVLRAPKTEMTVLHLMTHTAGLSYPSFDQPTVQYQTHVKQNPAAAMTMVTGKMKDFFTPLASDPGTKYTYGINTDYLGFVVEAVSGMAIDDYIQQHIFDPLEMRHSGSHLKPECSDPFITHFRGEDASLTAQPGFTGNTTPGVLAGGHYLTSTLDDYSAFLLTILNNGTHPKTGVQILKPDTVKDYIFTDQVKHCPTDGIGTLSGAIPFLSNTGTMLPGVKKTWSCGLMLNLDDHANGRNAGSGAWAGLGNLYYFLDQKAGKLAFIMCATLPFLDKEVLHLFDELERALYDKGSAGSVGEKGSNFALPA